MFRVAIVHPFSPVSGGVSSNPPEFELPEQSFVERLFGSFGLTREKLLAEQLVRSLSCCGDGGDITLFAFDQLTEVACDLAVSALGPETLPLRVSVRLSQAQGGAISESLCRALATEISSETFDVIVVKGRNRNFDRFLPDLPGVKILILGGASSIPRSLYDVVALERPQGAWCFRFGYGTDRVYLPKFVPSSFRWSDGSRCWDFVVVADFVSWKGHSLLLEQAESMAGRSIVFVGDGPGRVDFEASFAELAQSHSIRSGFTGRVSCEVVGKFLQKSNLLLLPSRSEGVPRAVVEAMSCGVPPVVDRKVVSWPVNHLRNGIRTSRGSFIKDATRVLDDDEVLQTLRIGAQRTASQHWSTDRLSVAFEELATLVARHF